MITKGDQPGTLSSFVFALRRQDVEDERYIKLQKVLPLAIGIIVFSFLISLNPIRNLVMLGGSMLILLSLIATMVLFLLDCARISRERFDASVFEFLQQKESRLRRWRKTALKYNIMFGLYIIGIVLLTLGNDSTRREFTGVQIAIPLATIVILLLFFWITGERRYRRRHQEKHVPLLSTLEEIRQELAQEE